MPPIDIAPPRPLCPPGEMRFRLKEVEKKRMPTFDKTGEEDRLIWKFVSDKRDPETGAFYEISVFTKSYWSGDNRAKLTWLLKFLEPGIDNAWVARNGLDTDRYVGRDYEACVVNDTATNDPTKRYANFLWIKPVGAAAAPAPIAGPDPFVMESPGDAEGCEVCGKALSDSESAACIQRWKGAHYFCLDHGRVQIQVERASEEDLFATA